MKKGQTEIIGLIVIVMLFIFIGMFFLIFALSPESTTPEIRRNIEASNLLNAMMKLTPCQGEAPPKPVNNIIKDCHLNNGDYCGSDCKEYINTITNNVMLKFGKRYSFEIKVRDGGIFLSQGSCSGEKITADYPLRAGNDFIVVWLRICEE